MSLSQSKIKFNVRKKRVCAKTSECAEKSKDSPIKLNIIENGVECPSRNEQSDFSSDNDVENEADTALFSSLGRKLRRRSSVYFNEKFETEDNLSPRRNRKSAVGRVCPSSVPLDSMTKLNLDRCVSDERLIKSTEVNLKPRKLFVGGSCDSKSTKYRAARIALGPSSSFVSADSDQGRSPLIGRNEQFQDLLSLLHTCVKNNSTVSVYVSGPPGTGKTASLGHIMEDPMVKSSFRCIYLNCTSMRTAASVYSHVARAMDTKVLGRSEKEWISKIEHLITHSKKKIVLILDEMDQLLVGGGSRKSAQQDVLYTLFGWPHIPGSRLSLIGVANALDLTSRALPRLHATHPPVLIHFPPYTREEIHQILLHRLSKAGVGEVFSVPALQMLASKVASVSGDVRRALDVGRRVVQLVGDRDNSAKKCHPPAGIGVLQPTSDHGTNSDSPRKRGNGPVVELQEVLSVLNGVYSTSSSLVSSASSDGSTSKENGLPVQQKVLLCSLILLVKKGPKGKPITIGRLHEVYCRACKGRNITPLDQSEFHSLCTLVETRGILRLQSGKEARLSKVSLQWDEEEVGGALMDQHMLASILSDSSLLSR